MSAETRQSSGVSAGSTVKTGKLAVCLEFSRKVRKSCELLSHCNNRDPQTYLEGEDECIILTSLDKVPFLKNAIKLLGIPRRRGRTLSDEEKAALVAKGIPGRFQKRI